ncbi:hypothetical protein HJG60_010392 [Phyllostomus discolor]|uniref:Uncharacterized protein n=1 Tax=Phyllostomus discolor TaxID=89673 RepID=A0A834EKC9_9CHIR|nr:hypothetical protein HJG60_010392 [Phyllostomus discolor]
MVIKRTPNEQLRRLQNTLGALVAVRTVLGPAVSCGSLDPAGVVARGQSQVRKIELDVCCGRLGSSCPAAKNDRSASLLVRKQSRSVICLREESGPSGGGWERQRGSVPGPEDAYNLRGGARELLVGEGGACFPKGGHESG